MNNTSKLRVDIPGGTLEVEGSEEFVKQIYEDFKERLGTLRPKGQEPRKPAAARTPRKQNSSPSGTKPKPKSPPALLKHLDLSGGGSLDSLKDFFSRYEHKTNYERNLIFVYYLKQTLGLENLGLDHVFTCYRHTGLKVPKALEQSLRDTAKDKGWVDVDDMDNIGLPIAGINHLEHELLKKAA